MLRILLQKTCISQIYYANAKPLFPHPAIFRRNTLEICEYRRASGATTPSGHGTAAFPRLSRADNSDLCVTRVPNRTFAKPYVSRPFLSHAQSFNASSGVFDGLMQEMRELSKKKPDTTLSKNKVRILNRVLADIESVLRDEPEAKYLESLDDDELPQNSDAVLVMVQHEKALAAFRKRYLVRVPGIGQRWATEEGNEVDEDFT